MSIGLTSNNDFTENEVSANGNADLSSDVTIGKDILELLSSSMYVDPLTVFREYVQNAVDAIDEAVEAGLIQKSEGRVDIYTDHIERRTLIRDNGMGVPNQDFAKRMTAFGASKKRGTTARGFRGVGRLAGLGYCQELIFRSRSSGDKKVWEISWDCRKLKKLLTDHSFETDLNHLVREIVSFKQLPSDEFPDHFFEVEIRKPIRLGNDLLLNEMHISAYLSQNGPMPFDPKFPKNTEIKEALDGLVDLEGYHVYLNDNEAPIYRPFNTSIPFSETRFGDFGDLEVINIEATDGQLAAVGWILHHEYQGAIPSSAKVKGLRARVGNIQVGPHDLFSEIFPETRFNSWTVGEVHILDHRIMPNGRRDHFEQNSHFANLQNHLSSVAYTIARNCRNSSSLRNRIKTFDLGLQKTDEWLDILEQGAVSKASQKKILQDVGSELANMAKVAGADLLEGTEKSDLGKKLAKIQRRADAVSGRTGDESPLEKLPVKDRKAYQNVFDLIYECSQSRIVAKALVDKILSRLVHSK